MNKFIGNSSHKIFSYLWMIFAIVCFVDDKQLGIHLGVIMSSLSYLTHMVYTAHKQYLEIEMAKAKIEKSKDKK